MFPLLICQRIVAPVCDDEYIDEEDDSVADAVCGDENIDDKDDDDD